MASIHACLFDLDGVIVNTAKYHYLAWRRLAAELGFSFTEMDNERLKGVSRSESLEILLEIGHTSVSQAEKERLAAKKNAWYVEMIAHMDPTELLPGAKAFVASVRAFGIKAALGSASKNARQVLTAIQMTDAFDAIVDGTETTKAKPDPDIFLLCAAKLQVVPAECVVFEDAAAGIAAAKRAGMRAIGIGSSALLQAADDVVSSLADMSLERLFGDK